MRCVHESEMYSDNSFVTLTFDAEHLPRSGSVDVRDLQLFFKRLRKRVSPARFRYFACGEYGEGFERPHYHAVLFGLDFPDKRFIKMSGQYRIYESELLNETWGQGLAWIGTVTFESVAYVARYVLKKRTGRNVGDHYTTVDGDGVVVGSRLPEFVVMSRRPGIGSGWFSAFRDDVYGRTKDHVVVRGIKMRPPKFYDSKLEVVDVNLFKDVRARRLREAGKAELSGESSTARRIVRERVAIARQGLTKRRFERGS